MTGHIRFHTEDAMHKTPVNDKCCTALPESSCCTEGVLQERLYSRTGNGFFKVSRRLKGPGGFFNRNPSVY